MHITSKRLVIAASAIVLYAVLLLTVWAIRPLEDSIPVGIDFTPTTAVPPAGQRLLSQDVECNTLFASAPHNDDPLPVLTPQPEGRPALEYQREPCALVHGDARRNLAINGLFVVGALAAVGYLAIRQRRSTDSEANGPAAYS